ncbi:MAG: DUF4926 domain-containing protein [Tepidisphaeraceae bacterium]|jgi:hypothetical protein
MRKEKPTVELYQQVALRRDVPQENLRKGDVATVVELVPHSSGGPQGWVIEVFDAVGQSITVTAVSVDNVEAVDGK